MPFSSILIIESVTSWRKSRRTGTAGDVTGVSITDAMGSLRLLEIGLRRFVLETGTVKGFAAQFFQALVSQSRRSSAAGDGESAESLSCCIVCLFRIESAL